MVNVVIMAGGTGGHIFPALAVADELKARGAKVSWLGTHRGMEADIVPGSGYEIDWVEVYGLRGNGLLGWLKAPWLLSKAVWQAVGVMRARQPDVVLGMGGFVTGPGGVAAGLLKIPLVIHEQNSVAGMTNRLLSKIATRVLVAFPNVFPGLSNRHYTGNPLRSNVGDMPDYEARFQTNERPLRLLVVGGSLGAAALNQVVPEALTMMSDTYPMEVWHQTGKRHLQSAQENYANAGMDARVVAFIDDMAAAYAWADLVICRAGALTVAELAAVGVASILVPYPHAVDDHQTTNAQFLLEADAAELLQQCDLSAERLAERLIHYASERERLHVMAGNARRVALPQATREVADICWEVAGHV